MAPMSRRFVAALERYARTHEIEVVPFRPGERKDDVMAERLKRFDDAEGVVFIGKAQEKAPVFRTVKRRSPDGQSYPWIVRSTAMVNQYYISERRLIGAISAVDAKGWRRWPRKHS